MPTDSSQRCRSSSRCACVPDTVGSDKHYHNYCAAALACQMYPRGHERAHHDTVSSPTGTVFANLNPSPARLVGLRKAPLVNDEKVQAQMLLPSGIGIECPDKDL